MLAECKVQLLKRLGRPLEIGTVQAAPPPLGATVVQDSSDDQASREGGNQQ